MSDKHDLNKDLGTDVRLELEQKRNTSIASKRQESQPHRRYYGYYQARRNNRDNEQQVWIGNGDRNQRDKHHFPQSHHQPDDRPPGPFHCRRPLIDPVIREQRRLFYQSHYRNNENETKLGTNYTKRQRSFRNRTFQPNDNNAQCDRNGQKKEEAAVPLENGIAKSGSEPCLPEEEAKESLVSHNSVSDHVTSRDRSAVDRHASSHPQHQQHGNVKRKEESGVQESETRHGRQRSARNRRTRKQSESGKKKTGKDVSEEKRSEDKEVKEEEEVVALEEEEAKDCPLCLEPLDPTECNLYPCCFCKFQICLFCLNRLKEEEEVSGVPSAVDHAESQKRVCGSCPGCRNPYPADSDDESMAIAVRMTKKRAKAGTERAGKGNRNTNWKQETAATATTTTTTTAENTHNRTPGNRSRELLTQAKRPPHDHHKQAGKETVNYQSEKASDCRADRWRGNSEYSHSRRERGPGRRQVAGSSRPPVRAPPSHSQPAIASCDPDPAPDQKQDATSIKEESTEEKKQELVSLLSSLGLSPCNIRFHPQRQES